MWNWQAVPYKDYQWIVADPPRNPHKPLLVRRLRHVLGIWTDKSRHPFYNPGGWQDSGVDGRLSFQIRRSTHSV